MRIIGSIHTGAVLAYDVIRMLSREGRPTPLDNAIAHYGRIAESLRILRSADEPGCRTARSRCRPTCRKAVTHSPKRSSAAWPSSFTSVTRTAWRTCYRTLPGHEPTSPRRSTHGDRTKHQAGQPASGAVPHRLPVCCHHDLLGTTTAGEGSEARGHAVTAHHGSHGPEGRPGRGDGRSVAAVQIARPGRGAVAAVTEPCSTCSPTMTARLRCALTRTSRWPGSGSFSFRFLLRTESNGVPGGPRTVRGGKPVVCIAVAVESDCGELVDVIACGGAESPQRLRDRSAARRRRFPFGQVQWAKDHLLGIPDLRRLGSCPAEVVGLDVGHGSCLRARGQQALKACWRLPEPVEFGCPGDRDRIEKSVGHRQEPEVLAERNDARPCGGAGQLAEHGFGGDDRLQAIHPLILA
ncbi:Tn3 family transposase [Streptomyces sp. BE147]|nr:Tn3 family transposase [Streptomyces sp. BE147]MEE1735782.1 Tn3 family transposase [Streptomyces sp. BE147]